MIKRSIYILGLSSNDRICGDDRRVPVDGLERAPGLQGEKFSFNLGFTFVHRHFTRLVCCCLVHIRLSSWFVHTRHRIRYCSISKYFNFGCHRSRQVYKSPRYLKMHRNFIIVRENHLVCTVHVSKGQIVFYLEGQLMDYPTKESIHIGKGVHIVDDLAMFMTHSFEPSCLIHGLKVIANRDILPGDILHYNFNSSEVNMVCPFVHNGIIVKGKTLNIN